MRILPQIVYKLHKLFWRITKPTTLGVRLVLEKDQKVVLVRHTYHKQWFLPGGGVKKGETFEEAVRREAREELGIPLGLIRIMGVYSNFHEHKNDHIVVFSCNDFKLIDHNNYEIESIECFPLNALPEDISMGTLRRIREYQKNNSLPIVGSW